MLFSEGLAPRYSWFVLSVLSLVLLLAACVVPATTPTPTPTPTPTLTPTPTPTATPGVPAPVTVDLSGKMDAAGKLTEAVAIASSDGRAKLTLPAGATVLDAQKQPGKSITITPYRPPESKEGVVVGLAYDIGGAVKDGTVSPAATLVMTYDPPSANPRIDLTKPQISGWWEPKKSWVSRPAPVTVSSPGTLTSKQANIIPVVVIFWFVDLTAPVS
ncbi:MAG: hypothetical protein ABIG98_06770 [Chloroflexota bacterium]